jgi:opacity protein-like surface antigen
MRRASLAAPSFAALVIAGSAGGAFAQAQASRPDAPNGSSLAATVSERFEIDDNYQLDDPSPGTSYFADTRLAVDYLKQTETQSFTLGFNTGLRALWQAQEDFDFVLASPTSADVGYVNEWSNGAFDAAFAYRQRQVDYSIDTEVTDPSVPPQDLGQLQGNSRELRYDANVGVIWGTATRSSYELRFLGSQVDYTDTDPDHVARTTLQGQGAWNLILSPVLTSTVTADYLAYSADNAQKTELDRTQVGAGLIYTPSETLTLGAGIDYAKRKRTDLDGAGERETTNDDSGPGVNGTFRYITPDVVVSGDGEWTTAAPTSRFFGTVRATYLLPRGRISGRVFQNYTGTSGGGNEARVTGAGLSLVRDINSISSFGLDVSYATQIDVEDGPGDANDPDIERLALTATYSHELTETVSADVGYSYNARNEDPTNASSNAVFFQIGKTFEMLR